MLKNIKQNSKEFYNFIKERNLWYLLPIFISFLLVWLVIILAETTPVWPFIYTIF